METSQLKHLDWDSGFFGKSIYRFDLVDTSLNDYLHFIKGTSAQLVYLFSKTKLPIHQTEHFFLADTKIIYRKKLDTSDSGTNSDNIFVTSHATDDLKELALLSGNFSRFKLDPFLAEKFESFYLLWLTRSLSGEFATVVFTYRIDNRDQGFVTVKVTGDKAVIGLIATNPQLQGKGIGSRLLQHVDWWCLQNNVKIVDVATQGLNTGACAFYERNNYEVSQTDYIYHHYLL